MLRFGLGMMSATTHTTGPACAPARTTRAARSATPERLVSTGHIGAAAPIALAARFVGRFLRLALSPQGEDRRPCQKTDYYWVHVCLYPFHELLVLLNATPVYNYPKTCFTGISL